MAWKIRDHGGHSKLRVHLLGQISTEKVHSICVLEYGENGKIAANEVH